MWFFMQCLTPPWGWGLQISLLVNSGLEWRGSIHSSGRELCAFFFPLPHYISVRCASQLFLHWKQSTDLSLTLSMTWEWQYQACNPALKRCAMQNRLIAATNAGVKLICSLAHLSCQMHFSSFLFFFFFNRFQRGTYLCFWTWCKLWHSCTFIFSIVELGASYDTAAPFFFSLLLNLLLFDVIQLEWCYFNKSENVKLGLFH